MQFEIGLAGLGLLFVISLGFGVVAQLIVGWRATGWLWLIGAAAWFIGGLFASEVVWGTMTVDEIQPIIDGLAFDEALLGGVLLGVPAVIVTWLVTRRTEAHRTTSAAH
jgi:hypothetical protein